MSIHNLWTLLLATKFKRELVGWQLAQVINTISNLTGAWQTESIAQNLLFMITNRSMVGTTYISTKTTIVRTKSRLEFCKTYYFKKIFEAWKSECIDLKFNFTKSNFYMK